MWHSYTVASALVVTSIVAVNSTALAQSTEIQFNGTVPVQATFSNVVPGTVDTIATGRVAGNFNAFESVTPATLTVQSSVPATITVSPPSLVSGNTPDPPGTTRVGFLTLGSIIVRSDISGGTANLPAGNTALEVDMFVDRPEPFPPGTYTYAVTVTITP